jgi:hypothetical protein
LADVAATGAWANRASSPSTSPGQATRGGTRPDRRPRLGLVAPWQMEGQVTRPERGHEHLGGRCDDAAFADGRHRPGNEEQVTARRPALRLEGPLHDVGPVGSTQSMYHRLVGTTTRPPASSAAAAVAVSPARCTGYASTGV